MTVKIQALDTFHDHRVHVGGMGGAVHKGKTANVSEHVAGELEKAGLVKILGKVSGDTNEDKAQDGGKKAITTPENKALKTDKLSNKGK